MITFKSEDSRSIQMYYIDGVKEKCLGMVNKTGNLQDQAIKLIKELPFDWEMIKQYEAAKEEIVKTLTQIVR